MGMRALASAPGLPLSATNLAPGLAVDAVPVAVRPVLAAAPALARSFISAAASQTPMPDQVPKAAASLHELDSAARGEDDGVSDLGAGIVFDGADAVRRPLVDGARVEGLERPAVARLLSVGFGALVGFLNSLPRPARPYGDWKIDVRAIATADPKTFDILVLFVNAYPRMAPHEPAVVVVRGADNLRKLRFDRGGMTLPTGEHFDSQPIEAGVGYAWRSR